jgi:multiple antibiotic resistance protein
MWNEIIPILVMMNPIGLFLYLAPIRKQLSRHNFIKVLFKASLISFSILFLFFLTGNFLFEEVFRIHFESFRIFGGIVIFSFSYLFIVKGKKAFIHMKEDLDDLASEIALPFMVGAGTISLTVLLSYKTTMFMGTMILLIAMGLAFLIILLLNLFREKIPLHKFKVAFDKNMEVLLRLNGFFIGAIGINMVITGILGIV